MKTPEGKRPTVQVGDPFSEKLLLEACLEIMQKDCVIAIQDMGAAGLTCSAVEMGAKGDLGVTLDLDKVPCREESMSAYEMMLSESQERMLMVLKPEKEKEAEEIFRKWGLDFAVVGETTPTKRFVVRHGGDVMADLPIKELGDQAPEYKRPFVSAAKPEEVRAKAFMRLSVLLRHWRSCWERPTFARSVGFGSNTITSSLATPYNDPVAMRQWFVSRMVRKVLPSPRTSRRATARPIHSKAASRQWQNAGAT